MNHKDALLIQNYQGAFLVDMLNEACGFSSGRATQNEDWKELCYLWASDFRTHLTERRWTAYRARLAAAETRWSAPLPPLDLARAGRLDFGTPDTDAFPCLKLAYRALEAERSLPVVLNAANEIAVALFLDGKLGFTSIAGVIEQTMAAHRPAEVGTLAAVRAVDGWAREHARDVARGLESKV